MENVSGFQNAKDFVPWCVVELKLYRELQFIVFHYFDNNINM